MFNSPKVEINHNYKKEWKAAHLSSQCTWIEPNENAMKSTKKRRTSQKIVIFWMNIICFTLGHCDKCNCNCHNLYTLNVQVGLTSYRILLVSVWRVFFCESFTKLETMKCLILKEMKKYKVLNNFTLKCVVYVCQVFAVGRLRFFKKW